MVQTQKQQTPNNISNEKAISDSSIDTDTRDEEVYSTIALLCFTLITCFLVLGLCFYLLLTGATAELVTTSEIIEYVKRVKYLMMTLVSSFIVFCSLLYIGSKRE